MSLPTNRQPHDLIKASDINAIAAAVNSLADDNTDTSHTHDAEDLSGVVKTVNGTGPDEAGNVVVSGSGVSHESISIAADVTLPVTHPVLTVRATAPALVDVEDAPDGTVITVHVAHGWEHITWAPGITVTGDSVTTETWVVLVRKEGGWSALVSGSGGGGMSGHGRPDGVSWPYGEPSWSRGAPVLAPLGTVYTDLDGTDGAVQWTVTGLGYIWWHDPDTDTYPEMQDGPIWEVTIGSIEWERGSQSYPDPLTPPTGYDYIGISVRRKGDWVDVEISLEPSGIGQGVPVTVPEVLGYSFEPPDGLSPSNSGKLPMEVDGDPNFVAAVGEPPQALLDGISFLSIPSFEVGAFTAGEWAYMWMGIKTAYRIKEPLGWPSQMERPDTPPGDGGPGGGQA